MSTSSDPSSAEPPYRRVAVVGLGLMGGSLARGLSALPTGPTVVGWSPDRSESEAAVAAGALAEAPGTRAEAVAEADLVVLAAPLSATCDMLAAVAEEAPPSATLTDVASLKVPVLEAARKGGVLDRWVGSHPMAGAEGSGFAAASDALFRNARVWTVADPSADGRVEAVHRLWRLLGADPEPADAAEHDSRMALVSHLPQLTANILAEVLAGADVPWHALGTGGRGMTRLAESDAVMWADILRHARPELIDGLRGLAASTDRVVDLLEAGDVDALRELMRRTAGWRGTE